MYEDYLSKALSNIIMAKQAIKAFLVTNNKDMKNGASYHAQQAIEFIRGCGQKVGLCDT